MDGFDFSKEVQRYDNQL